MPINPVSLHTMRLLVPLLLQVAMTEQTGELHSARLLEASGVVASRAHAGILWTHNDSGDGPFLYATDLQGTDRGALLVPGATALDWEDIAIGPCPPRVALPDGRTDCIFIGDVGDNLEGRAVVRVYAVPEPDPPTSSADTLRTTRAPRVLRFRYPDGSHDVEAIYVAPRGGALFLVSKGRSGVIRLYRVAPELWKSDTVVTATLVQQLDIRPDPVDGRWITAASIRADGRVVALRTTAEIYFFTPGVGGRLGPARPVVCPIGGVEYQGEAIDFLDDSTMVVMSESAGRERPGRIHIVRCQRSPAR